MIFLYPAFLFALFATAIPVIIHLYNFRRYKTIFFSNVSFLKSLKQETKASSQIKHWLILFFRILTVAALVLAFAQPVIPTAGIEKLNTHIVGLYLDNSFSMEGQGSAGKLFEMAKNKARRVITAFRPGTRFLYSDNDFAPQHQHLVSSEQILQFIGNAELSSSTRKLSEVTTRQSDFFRQNLPSAQQGNSTYFVSDFQKSTSDLQQMKKSGGIIVNLLPLISQSTNNIFIDSCWFETPNRQYNQPDEIKVKVVNISHQSYQNIPLKLYLNDSLKSVSGLNIGPGESQVVGLAFTNTKKGWINGKLELTDYPVTFDNAFFFSFRIADKMDVLVINENGENKYLNMLFAEDTYFPLVNTDENSVNYAGLAGYATIIVNEFKDMPSGLAQALQNYVAGGGTLVLIPHLKMDIPIINNFLLGMKAGSFSTLDTSRTNISVVNYESALYRGSVKEIADKTDFPIIFKHFPYNPPSNGAEILLGTSNHHNILSRVSYKKGQVYLIGQPLRPDLGNLVKHALFIPTFYNIVLQSLTSSRLYYIIGKDDAVDLMPFEIEDPEAFKIIGIGGKFDLIPEMRQLEGVFKLFVQQYIQKAGYYEIQNKNKKVGGFSFNYNRKESVLEFYEPGNLKDIIGQNDLKNIRIIDSGDEALPQAIVRSTQGTPLWKWFIIMALIFIAFEITLVRLWK